MINVEFYNFSKKSNSTARPSEGTTVPVDLKKGTTFQSPTFVLRYGLNDFLNFNYAKWNDHYYFINSVTSIKLRCHAQRMCLPLIRKRLEIIHA